jgi:hypothetical protein
MIGRMDGGKRFIGGMRGPRRLEAPTAARHDILGGRLYAPSALY